jgi:hypothetical protein
MLNVPARSDLLNQRLETSDDGNTLMRMYDVIYIDFQGDETPVAEALEDRQLAATIARRIASERGAGRLVLPGSSKLSNCVCVVPQPAPDKARRR